jgi:hypothetical protein
MAVSTTHKTVTFESNGIDLPPLTYLATPYSYKHTDERVRKAIQQIRFEECTKAASWLITEHGWNVFSPITHSHPLHVLYPGIRGDWPFWEKIDVEYLKLCQRFVCFTIPGWRKSTGVNAESDWARKLGLDFWYCHPMNGTFRLTRDPVVEAFPKFEDTDL